MEQLFVIGAAALVDSVNPCAISVMLLTIGFLLGLKRSRRAVLTIGITYVLGVYLAYILIGVGILQALTVFGAPHFMAKVGAGIIIAAGLVNIINSTNVAFPVKLQIPGAAHSRIARVMEKASVPAAFLLGGLVGIFEFPCTGGPYMMVLGLLHDQATFWRGLVYLLYYNALFVLPLVVILVLASRPGVVERVRGWQKSNRGKLRLYSGLAMVALGIIIFLIY